MFGFITYASLSKETAQSDQNQKITTPIEKEKAVEEENTICPVLGEEILEGTSAKVEYKGKIYNLCCVPRV